MQRRHAIRTIGLTGLGVLGTAGRGVAASATDDLVALIRDRGYYTMNLAGTDTGNYTEHFYRADHPFRGRTDAGGDVAVRPGKNGIRATVDLGDQGNLAGAGFSVGNWELGAIETVHVSARRDPVNVGLWLDTSGDGALFEWERVRKGREHLVDIGDDRMVGGIVIENGCIDRKTEFGPDGDKHTIERLIESEGDATKARFSVGYFGSTSGTRVIERFDVEAESG